MSNRPLLYFIDDEQPTVDALTRIFRTEFDTKCFTSANAALQNIATDKPAVVIADQRMPDMSGLDFLVKVKETSPETVRTMLTAHMDLDSISDAINNGVLHRFFLKPWENEVLRSQIRECIAMNQILISNIVLSKLATTDPLTGVHNHRSFQEIFRIEVERAKRHGRSLGLLMLDLDHFKNTNDRYGHLFGDLALKTVTQKILGLLREIDIVARYGGDEFAIILPDTPFDATKLVAERIRKACDTTMGEERNLTISLGVASFPEHGSTPQEILGAADNALLMAKKSGRNQCLVADIPQTRVE